MRGRKTQQSSVIVSNKVRDIAYRRTRRTQIFGEQSIHDSIWGETKTTKLLKSSESTNTILGDLWDSVFDVQNEAEGLRRKSRLLLHGRSLSAEVGNNQRKT
mmetsp:Transcript_9014/g.13424  ORF Transcript_9014/g.13424 Transcript_9014/m.13424 type:complete len:102 (-) Transcript_9014:41-346(-)